jgi:aspartyl protease family protein
MPDRDGPWRRNPPPRRERDGTRAMLWLALLLAGGLGLWTLADIFPDRLSSDESRAYLVRSVVVLALLASGLAFSRRIVLGTALRNLAIWAGIIVVLILGFTFQDELRDVAVNVRSELIPGYPAAAGANEFVLTANADGHFHIIGEANGAKVDFLIDTGASDIVLAPADARRLGIDTDALRYTRVYRTANGLGRGASFVLPSLSIGPIARVDVPVSINQSEASESLLGMSFLTGMASIEIRGRKLYLRWR